MDQGTCVSKLLRYLSGTWTNSSMHGPPSAVVDAVSSSLNSGDGGAGNTLRTSLDQHVVSVLYHQWSVRDSNTSIRHLQPVQREEYLIERAVENAIQWLSYAAQVMPSFGRIRLSKRDRRRLECDLDELFTEALRS